MPLTIVAEIRSGRRVVGLVTLGAIGRISAARYYGARVPVVAGVVVSVAVAIIIGVVVTKISIGVVVATVAITQRATGR
jgi:tetrahydromethanopterin S-methyltransferase subunit C